MELQMSAGTHVTTPKNEVTLSGVKHQNVSRRITCVIGGWRDSKWRIPREVREVFGSKHKPWKLGWRIAVGWFWLKKPGRRNSTGQISDSRDGSAAGQGGQHQWEDKCYEQLCDRSRARLLSLARTTQGGYCNSPSPLIPAHRKNNTPAHAAAWLYECEELEINKRSWLRFKMNSNQSFSAIKIVFLLVHVSHDSQFALMFLKGSITCFLEYWSLSAKDWEYIKRLFCLAGLFLRIQHYFGSSETVLFAKINHYCAITDRSQGDDQNSQPPIVRAWRFLVEAGTSPLYSTGRKHNQQVRPSDASAYKYIKCTKLVKAPLYGCAVAAYLPRTRVKRFPFQTETIKEHQRDRCRGVNK